GRFAGYIGFGAFFGAVGGAIPISVRTIITAIAFIVLGALLIFQVFRKPKPEEGCRWGKLRKIASHPAVFGLLLGINPCPAFLLTLSRAIDAGGALAGIFLFAGFFVGTTVFFLPISAVGELGRLSIVRRLSKVIALLVGLWFLANGLITISRSALAESDQHFDVVEIFDADTVFLAGDGDLLVYFEDIFDFDGEFLSVEVDSTPDGAWLITFDEPPDTAALLMRGVNVISAPSDSASAVRTAELLSNYAFKRLAERGFYFRVD
ncbi:MAG TPA: sulfite exporter TauE/SafE family protein, partial [candidate division Zixibacteria bacterium]|nr:sulfite exporter TauE/SafE family protein [candidate division Zixibacteria bacterium]